MIRTYKGNWPQIAPTAFIETSAQVIGDVQIGEHSSVWFNCVIRGDVHYIRVGHSTNIQDGTVIHVTNGRFPTEIGNHVTIGHGVMIHGCTIKDRSLVGIGSIILDNAIIGEESFIAAGSLVTPGTVIPPRSMVMGSPAKVRREVTESEIELINRHWQNYIEYKNNYMAEPAQ
ncbi:MAG TPA: gamma carbonic anhydrase family protein [Blastocatellia bacterium]|nr:gamma carbonic anhydrase family protein [Blastocatellia bacterium]